MRNIHTSTCLLVLSLFPLACGKGSTEPPPPPPPQPTAIQIVSGDGQNGKTEEALARPLVVRVVDAQGNAMPGVPVEWAVTSGAGTLNGTTVNTNADGESAVAFTPGDELGPSVIQASADGLTGSPVSFNAETTVFLIKIRGSRFRSASGGTSAVVAMGDTIEWVNEDNQNVEGPHTATSNAEPAGGSAFDSEILTQGNRFRFVPDAVGTWDYHCEVHGAALMSGTIMAQ